MSHMIYAAVCAISGNRENFDDLFNRFEAREFARRLLRHYCRGIESDIDREIALRMHADRIGEQATNADILATLARADLREIESLYGSRVRLAAARGRYKGNYSALRCFVREVRRAKRDMISVAHACG